MIFSSLQQVSRHGSAGRIGRSPLTSTVESLRSLHVSEEGTMAQVTVITILGFTMLVGLVGNVGRIVQKKVAVQNSADAVAYSSALWEARSLNAVTAINHMLGEVTALCVLHEAIGGPQLDEMQSKDAPEFKELNDKIEAPTRNAAAISAMYPPMSVIDPRVIGTAKDLITSDDDKTSSGAMLYDSRITLKEIFDFCQNIKFVARVLEYAGTIVPALIPLGQVLHMTGTLGMLKCAIEYGILNVIEIGAQVTRFAKVRLQQDLLPLLAKYPDPLVGSGSGNPLGNSIQATVKELESRHSVKANLFPAPAQIQLPLEAEREPKTSATGQPIRSQSVESGWPPALEKAISTIRKVDRFVSVFNSVVDWIPGAKAITGWFSPTIPNVDSTGSDRNPSVKTLKDLPADWKTEETTQWVRATYPWVDALRAPIISGFKEPYALQFSKAGVWYGHWTNRFTLAKSYSFRSGRPLSLLGGGPSTKLKMYVMKGMKPDRKGKESWTTDSPEAERLFTVIGFSTHRVDALFSPVIFGASGHDQVVYAQAMYYNANPQEPGNSGDRQPRVGWDTLNWSPPVSVPEYGTVPTERSSMFPPWDIFQRKSWSHSPQIKLNWQAKLVPVTRSRLSQAAAGGSYQGSIREFIGKGLLNTRQLDTH